MAFRKSTIQKQLAAKLAEFAPQGEQMQVAFQAITGPSPWVDDLPYVRFIMIFLRKYYFVVLTQTSVVLIECSKWSGRPTNFIAAEHFSTAQFTDMQINPVWSKVFYQLPNTVAPERLNVHRRWRTELDALVARLPRRFQAA
ncbi:hypothetical protein GPX89_19170 [Nocardia sp. ET3-3]|uniref:Uncharacterized protein n=1 Tax=Nocardia terrae TaxID=2675851 RepID=A0A7K1UYA8_9NOCA|nr:hypothetical protein [Nocardia terrae]MVU79354.1 hypothetical protein [Nocardia terrae]